MELDITLYNLAYAQPYSPFFIAVHNEDAPDLFRVGSEATPGLALLAEMGDVADVKAMFDDSDDVDSTMVLENAIGPLGSATFTVEISCKYPYVSMASMAVNTNDCFVGINHMMLMPGMDVTGPGYDAGSEANNEDWDYIPGPFW